jgi:hypothetical protein
VTAVLTAKQTTQSSDSTTSASRTPAPEIGIHPAAAVFPRMTARELQELADDIKANGLHHPIVRDKDGINLDGRNRLAACQMAGVAPRFETYAGNDPVGFIISVNLKRRHLNASADAVRICALRWRKAGRQVRIAMSEIGSDFNDILMAKAAP